jgi:DNA-binding MarR family transcriptional regulator
VRREKKQPMRARKARARADAAAAGASKQLPRLMLDDFVPYLINRVGSAMVERFGSDALAAHRLSIAMWRVLAALSHNGAQRQVDLAAMTSIEVSTLSRLVTRMVRMRLTTRTRSRHSSREVLVALSPKGRALVARLIPIALALEEAAIAGLDRTELAAAKRALRRMHKNLAPARREAAPR